MQEIKYYAGIGARKTPNEILDFQCKIATRLEKDGWLLSSGGAEGADDAFESGVQEISDHRIIIPKNGFNGKHANDGYINFGSATQLIKNQCDALASTIHPVWNSLPRWMKNLHSRNVMEILGPELDSPVKFVLYWAPEDSYGVAKGGTRTAVVLAQRLGIPTFNMLHADVIERLERKYL
jgi:hypothetical protein